MSKLVFWQTRPLNTLHLRAEPTDVNDLKSKDAANEKVDAYQIVFDNIVSRVASHGSSTLDSQIRHSSAISNPCTEIYFI